MTELSAYGGALSGDCPWYVERREDSEVFDRLAHGEGCYVLTSHQMGKSSLVVRLRGRCRHRGISTAAIDLAALGRELNASQWYNALALRVGYELDLEEEFESFLAGHQSLAPFDRFYGALDGVALRRLSSPLILFVDELDLLRSLPFFPEEFLNLIHSTAAWSDCARSEVKRLVFCLFATVAPSALWRDSQPIHLHLGRTIILKDFERHELFQLTDSLAGYLVEKNQLASPICLSEIKVLVGEILDRVFHWTHGHPYLTQKLGGAATNCLSSQLGPAAEITPAQCRQFVDSLSQRLFLNPIAREQDCHLAWIRQKLLGCGLGPDPSRTRALLQCVRHGLPADFLEDHESEALVNSGVACIRNGFFELRNQIYQRLFDEGWFTTQRDAQEVSTSSAFVTGSTLFTRQSDLRAVPATMGR